MSDTASDTIPDAEDASDGDVADGETMCTPTTKPAAVLQPVNMFVMFDKSSSMGPEVTSTKWAGARSGLNTFLTETTSNGLRIAMGFYPRPVDGTPVCDSAPYAIPRVAFGTLRGNATPMMTACDAERPDGFNSPFYPALGARAQRSAWSEWHQGGVLTASRSLRSISRSK
jgi:hypothetical protein